MKVLVITIGDRETGSTKYRIVQYEELLSEEGVSFEYVRREEVDAGTVARAAAADVVLNQKCLFKAALARRIIAAAKRVVYDFDDAVYTRPGKPYSLLTGLRVKRRLHLWLRRSDVVTPANEHLALYARRYAGRVEVIPMGLDLDAWAPAPPSAGRDTVTIGWAGSPGNVPNLERLEPVLAAVLERFPQARLAVFSGRKPELTVPFDYHPYRAGQEHLFVRELDIGLLPLIDEEHSRGKSPIKAIQYLACGVPVVGNVAGATAEICNPDNSIAVLDDEEWIAALARLIEDPAAAGRLGAAGRSHVSAHHDFRKNGEALRRCLLG